MRPPSQPRIRANAGWLVDYRAGSSAVERLVYTELVGGSIPSPRTMMMPGHFRRGFRKEDAFPPLRGYTRFQ